MSVWDGLVGQRAVIAALEQAAAGHGMSHAWLFTGPPGSGRSNAAVAFAAALECDHRDGCGACHACRTVLAGTHADVSVIRTEKLSIGVDEVRTLVRRSALAPMGDRWQILIVEDADRLTEQACNALLKAIEEPTDRTVWMLCAPTVEDVLPTIRSRCRLVTLATPTADQVAAFLRSQGADERVASYAARASQGHIGRARALAFDDAVRARRRDVVTIPTRLSSLGSCLAAASTMAEVTKAEADEITAVLDQREKTDLDSAYGVVERGRRPREYAPALRDLEKGQKTRAKRRHLDMVDRGLMDLISVYRDAIALQTGAPGGLVNEEIREQVTQLARTSTPELNLRRIGWIFTAREQMLEFNVPVALALESMMVSLKVPEGAGR